MRHFAMCMECQKELGHPSFEPFFASYYDDRTAYIECSRGHWSAVLIQSQKFEVLMESGASALAAGFTLEAAASFSAALERFFEFCLKVMSFHVGLDPNAYEPMFKEMARQSERQFGAFLALYALQHGRPYRPNKKIATFRNSVIHKGLIPSPQDAEEFCSWVYAEVYKVFSDIKEPLASSIQQVVVADLAARAEAIPEGTPRATSSGVRLFNIAHAEHKPTFAAAYADFQKFESMLAESVPQMKAMSVQIANTVD